MRLPNQEQRFRATIYLLLAIIIGSLGLCAYWAADRQLPIAAQSGKFVGWDEHNPHIGWIEWTGVRQRYCEGISYRWLVNGVVIELAPIHVRYNGNVDNPEKKSTTWRVAFEIPEWYKHNGSYRVRIEYSCNPFQKFFPLVVSLPDIPFKFPGGATELLPPESLNVIP